MQLKNLLQVSIDPASKFLWVEDFHFPVKDGAALWFLLV